MSSLALIIVLIAAIPLLVFAALCVCVVWTVAAAVSQV
jgi:hypothetical protein